MLDYENRYRGNRLLRRADYVAIFQSTKTCAEVMLEYGVSRSTIYFVWGRRLGKWATHDLPDRTIDRRRRD